MLAVSCNLYDFNFFVPALAADSYTYEAEAEKLYELSLYKGTSTTVYEPNLGGKLDRQTGVVMLLRLFGQEERTLQMATEDAATKLAAKFTDAAEVADWAQRQVAYAVERVMLEVCLMEHSLYSRLER